MINSSASQQERRRAYQKERSKRPEVIAREKELRLRRCVARGKKIIEDGMQNYDSNGNLIGVNEDWFYNKYHKDKETQRPIIFEEFFEPWEIWFENRGVPNENGLAIFFQNITERKLIQNKINDMM